MIDLHCHILPNIDDGPESMKESILMVKTALGDGIDTIVATPHFINIKNIDAFLECRNEKIDSLISKQSSIELKTNILRGAEVYCDIELFNVKHIERLTLNGTQYILTELPMVVFPLYTEEFLYRLQLLGLIPIIAHPERNAEIIRKPELLYRLIDLGSLAQINTGSITGLFGQAVQDCAKTILKRKMAHIIATDAHSNGRRKPVMNDCIETLNNWVGRKEANKLLNLAPAAIIAGRHIDK